MMFHFNKIRLAAGFLATTMLTAGGFFAYAAGESMPFTDVSDSAWYADYIERAYQTDIMLGTSATTFSPDIPMTREMFVTALVKLDDSDVSRYENIDTGFTDVPMGQWYSQYLAYAAQIGIVEGIGNQQFGLGQEITREEMAVMLQNYAHMATGPSWPQAANPASAFTDMERVSAWAADAVEEMRLCGIFSGDTENRFLPKKTATRAEAVTALVKFAAAKVDELETIQIPYESVTVICLRSCTTEEPVTYEVSDLEEQKTLLAYINNAPVISKEYVRPASGWTYMIAFYDGESYLGSAEFGANWIEFDDIRYYTEETYFQPLLELADANKVEES